MVMFNRHQQLDPLFNVQNLTVFWASIGIAPNVTVCIFAALDVTRMHAPRGFVGGTVATFLASVPDGMTPIVPAMICNVFLPAIAR